MSKYLAVVLVCFSALYGMDTEPTSSDNKQQNYKRLQCEMERFAQWIPMQKYFDVFLPLYEAIWDRDLQRVQNFLEQNPHINLDCSVKNQKINTKSWMESMMSFELESDVITLGKTVVTPLSEAIKVAAELPSKGCLDIIKLLLPQQRLDVRFDNDMTYLHLAIKEELDKIVDLIIAEQKSRDNTRGYSCLEIGAWRSQTPLHYACAGLNIHAVQALITAGVNLQSTDWMGGAPLEFVYCSPFCLVSPVHAQEQSWDEYEQDCKKRRDVIINLFTSIGIVLSQDEIGQWKTANSKMIGFMAECGGIAACLIM